MCIHWLRLVSSIMKDRSAANFVVEKKFIHLQFQNRRFYFLMGKDNKGN